MSIKNYPSLPVVNKEVSLSLAPQDGHPPLYIAAGWGHLPVVKALVEAGADPHAKVKVSEARETLIY